MIDPLTNEVYSQCTAPTCPPIDESCATENIMTTEDGCCTYCRPSATETGCRPVVDFVEQFEQDGAAPPSLPGIAQDYMEPMLMMRIVEYSGCAWMGKQIDTNAHQDLLTTRLAEDVDGLTRLLSVALLLLLLMRREESSSAQDRQQQESSPSMLTQQTVGSTSCVLEEYQGSMGVLWVQSSMLGQVLG